MSAVPAQTYPGEAGGASDLEIAERRIAELERSHAELGAQFRDASYREQGWSELSDLTLRLVEPTATTLRLATEAGYYDDANTERQHPDGLATRYTGQGIHAESRIAYDPGADDELARLTFYRKTFTGEAIRDSARYVELIVRQGFVYVQGYDTKDHPLHAEPIITSMRPWMVLRTMTMLERARDAGLSPFSSTPASGTGTRTQLRRLSDRLRAA
jgi:hypothetical protein